MLSSQALPNAWGTKADAFVLMNLGAVTFAKHNTANAAFLAFRVGDKARHFLTDWIHYCSDPRIITDDTNVCSLWDKVSAIVCQRPGIVPRAARVLCYSFVEDVHSSKKMLTHCI